MNWSFSNVHLLPLAVLLALPFIVHLIARLRPRRYQFSSIEFILRSARKTRKWQRPRDWLLLLLRTAVVAALLLAFLQPRSYTSEAWSEEEDQERTVVLVIDATASMAYAEEGGSRFNRAVAEASGILGSLRPGDRANLVWVRDRPTPAAAQPSRNLNLLRENLQQARVSHETGSGLTAVETAVDLLAQTDGPKELILISDFQANSWEDPLPPIPEDTRLAVLPVARNPSPANTAVRRLWVEPVRPLAGETVVATAEVINHSEQPRRLEVLFASGPFRHREDVFLEARESRLVSTTLEWDEPGEHAVRAEIPEDAFPLDNRRDAVVEVTSGVRILLAGENTPPHPSWKRVFQALEWAEVATSEPGSSVAGHRADLVLWTGGDPRALDAFAPVFARGGTVLWDPVSGARANGTTLEAQRLRDPQQLNLRLPEDPLFAVFSGGEYGNPTRGRYSERLRWPEGNGARAETVLVAWQDEQPALFRDQPGEGRLYAWNIPLEENGSPAFAVLPEFVALAGEIAWQARETVALSGRETLPGRTVSRRFPSEWGVGEVVVTGPREHRHLPDWDADARFDRFHTAPLPEAGLYRWQSEGRTIGLTAVPFPADQSDLRTRDPDALEQEGGVTLAHAGQVRHLREGVDWWPLFLALAVAFMLAEIIICRFSRAPA